MKLNCFSTEFVAQLKSAAATSLKSYAGTNKWVLDSATAGNHLKETGIEVKSLPDLKNPSEADLADAENAQKVHEALRHLSPLQAMDERLWAYMTHIQYWDYMRARWPASTHGALVDRYLFAGTGFGTLVRNGIARLWWFGHVTWDPSRKNAYEMTEIMLQNQDVQQALLQRSFGKSRPVLHAILDHIKANQSTVYAEAIGTKIKKKAKMLNVLGGVLLLDAMPRSDIHEFLSRAE